MAFLKEIVGELGKKLEETPGLGLVVVLASPILEFLLHSVAPEGSVAILALAVSLVAYWVGGFLDDLLFEPIYGLPLEKERRFLERIRELAQRRSLAAKMIEARTKAAEKFQPASRENPTNQRGIYKTAKTLLSNTEPWNGRIKLWLDLSKTARTLILPAVCLLGWQLLAVLLHWPVPAFLAKHHPTAWLWNPIPTLLLVVISIWLYVCLRLRHMRRLYETLAGRPAFHFVVQPDSGLPEPMWSVGERVISERELPICRAASTERKNPMSKLILLCLVLLCAGLFTAIHFNAICLFVPCDRPVRLVLQSPTTSLAGCELWLFSPTDKSLSHPLRRVRIEGNKVEVIVQPRHERFLTALRCKGLPLAAPQLVDLEHKSSVELHLQKPGT